jgi:hypothetical protein
MICETTDFIFPMLADIYHPIVDQAAYGSVKKSWVLDRTIACNFSAAGTASKEEIVPNLDIKQDSLLLGRIKTDIRFSLRDDANAITNVVITNIRSSTGTPIYIETSGARKGKSTIFEVATQQPFMDPFGGVEYYKLIIRRSENQAVDL